VLRATISELPNSVGGREFPIYLLAERGDIGGGGRKKMIAEMFR